MIIETIKLPEKIDHNFVYKLDARGSKNTEYLLLDFSGTKSISLAGIMYLICLAGYIRENKSNPHSFYTEIKDLGSQQLNYLMNLGFFTQMVLLGNLFRVNNEDLKISNELLKTEERYKNFHLRDTNPNNTLIMPISRIMRGTKENFEHEIKRFRNDFLDFYVKLSQFSIFQFDSSDSNYQKDYSEISKSIIEIMKNIFDHSESWGIGAIYVSKKKGLQLCYYDIGIGIAESVKNNKKIIINDELNSIQWALSDGNSSKYGEDKISNNNQGRGFTVIEKFIKNKRGILSIRTGNYHLLSNNLPQKKNWFPGTQIVMYINNI